MIPNQEHPLQNEFDNRKLGQITLFETPVSAKIGVGAGELENRMNQIAIEVLDLF